MPVREVRHGDSVDSFFNSLRPLKDNYPGPLNSWIFRGQRESKWGLRPSLFRRDETQRWPELSFEGTIELSDLIRKEVTVLRRFVKIADSVGIRVPGDCYEFRIKDHTGEWPPIRDMEILAIAKHHGVPTRLLDFSYNGLIASFFAAIECLEQPDVDGEMAIWAFNIGKYAELVQPTSRSIQTVTVPTHENNYLNAQRALFIYDRLLNERWNGPVLINEIDADLDKVIENDLQRCEKLPCDEQDLIRKITLFKHKSRQVIERLHEEGIHYASLMPSYDNIVRQIKLEDRVGIKRI